MKATTLLSTAALSLAMLFAAPANAAVTFHLDNVTLVDGGTLNGTFTTTDDFSQLTGFSITSSSNDGWPYGNFAGITYDFANASSVDYTSTRGFRAMFETGYLDIYWELPLSVTGNIALDQTTGETYANQTRYLGEGSISVVPGVPEPATWGMMILGFGLIGTALRTRRQKVTVSYA